MAFVEVPGWFQQKYINKALAKVRKNGCRETERQQAGEKVLLMARARNLERADNGGALDF